MYIIFLYIPKSAGDTASMSIPHPEGVFDPEYPGTGSPPSSTTAPSSSMIKTRLEGVWKPQRATEAEGVAAPREQVI